MNIKNFFGRRVSHSRGFTLIELLVVMAIIAVLATLTMGAFNYAQQAAARNRTSGAMAAIKAALEQYKEKFGEYPEPVGPGSKINNAQVGGAQMLYQAITGDGTDAIKLGNSTGGSSDGQTNEEEMRNAINANLPPAMIYPPKSVLAAGTDGPRWLMDGFGRPFQYQKAMTSGAEPTTVNPTYDLWSYGNQEQGYPSDPKPSDKTNVKTTGTWIKNW